jgi:hypothetical protein
MLCEVHPGRDTWRFKFRVLSLWPTYAFMKADEINLIELVLIDEKVFVVTFDFV